MEVIGYICIAIQLIAAILNIIYRNKSKRLVYITGIIIWSMTAIYVSIIFIGGRLGWI